MRQERFALFRHDTLRKGGNHLDLRWTIPGSKNWISFALREDPPTIPGKRIYIVRTTEHSLDQAMFTGNIPAGQYGAGKLTKIDEGSCTVEKHTNTSMTVVFHGHKLNGRYHLINMAIVARNRRQKSKNIYAFFKAKGSIVESYILLQKQIIHENQEVKIGANRIIKTVSRNGLKKHRELLDRNNNKLLHIYYHEDGRTPREIHDYRPEKNITSRHYTIHAFREDGTKLHRRSFKKPEDYPGLGFEDGEHVWYYNDGKTPKWKTSYKNGERHGDAMQFSPNGNITSAIEYKRGQIVVPTRENYIQEMENIVHKSLVIGKPGEGHHITHPDFRYRSLGGNEISSIRQTGFVHPNPMGSKGGRKNVKHWTQGDGRQFYRPDQEVIRVHNSNMTPNEPVQAQHIELWHKPTNTFKPINDKYLNEQVFHKTQAAASIIVNKQGKFLVIRREPNDTSGGHWETPKGGVDPGEIPEQAVVRETKEEVGLDIQVIKLAKKISFYHPFKKRDVEFLIYFCKMTDPMQSVKLSHEHDAFKWVDINTFKKLMNWGDLGKNYINAANDISRDHRLRKMMTEGRMYKTYIVRIRSED